MASRLLLLHGVNFYGDQISKMLQLLLVSEKT